MAARGGGGLLDRAVERLPIDGPTRRTVATMARTLCVSAGTTLLSAGVLVVLAVGLAVPAAVANVIGTVCGIGPSYAWNRRWAWGRSGRGDLWREVVPFWALSLTGLVLSTLAVARTAAVVAPLPNGVRAVALPAANLTVFGLLWLVQFALLDRVLFRATRPGAGADDGQAGSPATSAAEGTLRTVSRGTITSAASDRAPETANAIR